MSLSFMHDKSAKDDWNILLLDVSGKILGLMAAHRRDKMPLFIGKRMNVYIFEKKKQKEKKAHLLIPLRSW